MAQETQDGGTAAAVGPAAPEHKFLLTLQYVKDLSFENPRAPGIFGQPLKAPQIAVQIDVNAQALAKTGDYEVVLTISAKAETEGLQVFELELAYGGLFTLAGIPKDAVQPLLLVEGGRLLFPYARSIVFGTTRDSGFPALMLQPIDFLQLYRRKVQQQASAPPASA